MDPTEPTPRPPRGSLVEWLRDRGLLRGPFLFADYWASVLRLRGGIPDRHIEARLVDPSLFRMGLDRPELEVPRYRHYLLLFFLGPLLLPFRSFRRLGRYRLSLRETVGEAILDGLRGSRLRVEAMGGHRVRVEKDGLELASGILDPWLVSGFVSLFYPVYKLPLASLTAIVVVAVLAPLLSAAGWLEPALEYWIPAGFPLLAVTLYAIYRDWATAILGALPVLFGRYLLAVLHPTQVESWLPFLAALAGLFLLYLAADWLFMPRPVPPVLMLYAADGPGDPYAREADAPWWLEGSTYWVWRYMMLTPGELNKFWERDWERVEVWIRADGEAAGALEWIVTDAHYRELWIPYGGAARPKRLERQREEALHQVADGRPGTWLVEVDAHMVFHTPFVRTVSFLPERGDVPVLGFRHLASAVAGGGRRDPTEEYLKELDLLRVRRGSGVLDDIPEAVVPFVARHLLTQPWRYWRYPLGAHRRWERRLYEREPTGPPPPAADPDLQIKAPRGAAGRRPPRTGEPGG